MSGEAEVLEALTELGRDIAFEMASFKIDPCQFRGLELNRCAVVIAQLVLWIGFFQPRRITPARPIPTGAPSPQKSHHPPTGRRPRL